MDTILGAKAGQDNTAPVDAGASQSAPESAPDTASQPSWIEGLPEDVRGGLEGVDSVETLARSYLEVKGKVPAVPESSDAYDLGLPDQVGDAKLWGVFKELAHKSGLSNDQAKAVAGFYMAAGQEEAKTIRTFGEESLRKEWGREFDGNVALARRAIDSFCLPNDRAWLNKTGFGSDPGVVKLFARIGKAISEDKLIIAEDKPESKPVVRDGIPNFSYKE